jgi:uncharacterized protein YqfA (UPF0365 family)
MLGFAYLLFKVFSCARLWVFARLVGISITFREMLRMQSQRIDLAAVIGALLEAKRAGLTISEAEIVQAYLQGVDSQKLILAMIEARRTGMSVTFKELVDAAVDSTGVEGTKQER